MSGDDRDRQQEHRDVAWSIEVALCLAAAAFVASMAMWWMWPI